MKKCPSWQKKENLYLFCFFLFVQGQKSYKGFNKEAVTAYKTLLLGWIIFGLGYLIMLLGYLTRAMRSKKVVKLEQKLVEALTRSKIWHGFTKDLGYMRRIMNELYLDKFKVKNTFFSIETNLFLPFVKVCEGC